MTRATQVGGAIKALVDQYGIPSIIGIRRFLGQPMKGSGSWPGFFP